MEIPRYSSRVGVPGIPRGQRLSAADFGGGTDLSAIGEAVAVVGDVIQKQDEADAVSFASTVTSTAARHFTTRIPELQQTATGNARGYAGTVDAEWDAWIESNVADAPNPLAGKMARERLSQMRQKSFSAAVGFEAQQVHAGRLTDFDTGVDALAVAAFNDPANAAKYLSQGAADLMAAEKTWMLPATATERKQAVIEKITQGALNGLIATAPGDAVAKLKAGYFDGGINAAQKSAFLATAENAVTQMENERAARIREAEAAAEKAEKAARLQTQEDLLARLNDPTQPAPSVSEIMKTNLDPVGQGSKDFFIKLAHKKMTGAEMNYTDPRKYRDLAGLVAQGKIRDPEVLQMHIGDGLSVEGYGKLKSDIEKAQTTAGQAELAQVRRAVSYAKTQLTGTTIFGGADTAGEQRLYSFEFELEREIDKGRAEGKTVEDMLDPTVEGNIINPLIKKYHRTPIERLHDQVQALNPAEPAPRPTAIPASENPAAAVQQRRPGETIAEYLERTGRK